MEAGNCQCASVGSGRLVMDDGEKVEIDGLIGWAEEHKAKW